MANLRKMSKWKINEKLMELFLEKQKANPRFSLRAFANQLKVDNSSLSQVLRKKRIVGSKLRKHLEQKLGVDFGPLQATQKPRKRLDFKELEIKNESHSLPWYFGAILEFAKFKKKETDVQTIAKQLGVSTRELTKAIEELRRLNYLGGFDKNLEAKIGMFKVFMNPAITNETAKNYQRKALEQSATALDKYALSDRIHNSIFFRFKKDNMTDMKKLTEKYLHDVIRLSQDCEDEADEVYCAQVSCFSMLKNGESN